MHREPREHISSLEMASAGQVELDRDWYAGRQERRPGSRQMLHPNRVALARWCRLALQSSPNPQTPPLTDMPP